MFRFCRSFLFLVMSLILSFAPLQAVAANRTALVIGNSAYGFGPLLNPANDAKLMAETLRKTGFDVTIVLDADRQTMQKALLAFSRDIRNKETVGLFYFAGHGAQAENQNYLIPVDADIKAESEVKIFGINVDEFVSTLEREDGRTNIVILDACRNNPFGAATRSSRRGLNVVDAPSGTFIAFSTSPGAVALDGDGENSPYAEALAKSMLQPNVSIEQTFKATRRIVLESTKQQQLPWETSSLTGDFSFSLAPVETAVTPAPTPEPQEPQVAVAEPPPENAEEPPPVLVQEQPPAAGYRTLEIEPKVYPVGKWPEGLVIANNAIYVAESGSRRIVKIEPGTGDLLETYASGRLPVNMTADPAGNVYAAVLTDGKIFKQPPDGKGKSIATVARPSYIQGLSFGNDAVHFTSYDEASQRQTILSRINPKTGKTTSSAPVGAEPRAFVIAQDNPWVLDATGMVTMFDKDTLVPRDSIANDGFLWSMGANLDAVFVGAREQQMEGKSVVYRYAQGNLQERTSVTLDSAELIMAVAANNDRVAALGADGTYWILDASSLQPVKRINTGRRPQFAVFENGDLYVTTHAWEGENGAVLVYEGVGKLD